MRALVTGCGGLIGTEACEQLGFAGWDVLGVDNGMRATFFGIEASTVHNVERLQATLGDSFTHISMDIRDTDGIERLFHVEKPELVIHTAAQPSHDWAARAPHIDFDVNARGTLNLLQAARTSTPDAPFINISTSKVYGDNPNWLPLERVGDRLDLPCSHVYYDGITTSMSVDLCTHSLFGVSKLAGDLLVQEYGRYFDMPTVCFRPGCLTGGNHAGTELHGFLSYLVRCAVTGRPYTVFGYDGLQVRCNVHSSDLVRAANPGSGAVYNIGGGRQNSISMLEAIGLVEDVTGKPVNWSYSDQARVGDHKWWVSSNRQFETDYPDWEQRHTLRGMVTDIFEANEERWVA